VEKDITMLTSALEPVDTGEAGGRWRLLRMAATLAAAVAVLFTLLPVAAAKAATACTADTGPRQTRVERFLGLVPDGTNSTSDCRAIRRFQRTYGIEPAAGYAGTVTGKLVKRLRLSAERADRCDSRAKVVCADLKSQTVWIAKGGTITWGPYPIRSGRDGYETRRGLFHVQSKDIDHVSSIFGSPMPYAMFFSGGQAFHTSDRYLYDPLGSHGCVHILPKIAADMWGRVDVGTAVQVFGLKPGT
jgi:lipoprotein-anchoring transpeptidase ErfK/SrfK